MSECLFVWFISHGNCRSVPLAGKSPEIQEVRGVAVRLRNVGLFGFSWSFQNILPSGISTRLLNVDIYFDTKMYEDGVIWSLEHYNPNVEC